MPSSSLIHFDNIAINEATPLLAADMHRNENAPSTVVDEKDNLNQLEEEYNRIVAQLVNVNQECETKVNAVAKEYEQTKNDLRAKMSKFDAYKRTGTWIIPYESYGTHTGAKMINFHIWNLQGELALIENYRYVRHGFKKDEIAFKNHMMKSIDVYDPFPLRVCFSETLTRDSGNAVWNISITRLLAKSYKKDVYGPAFVIGLDDKREIVSLNEDHIRLIRDWKADECIIM